MTAIIAGSRFLLIFKEIKMIIIYKKIIFIVAIGFAFTACTKDYDFDFSTADGINRYSINWTAAADSSTDLFLLNKYWNGNPGYFNERSDGNPNFQYWPQAHALDVVVDAYLRTGKSQYVDYFNKWYTGVKEKNGNKFLNDFYDDMGWNALATLRVYDTTHFEKFKDAVMELWGGIKGGWSENGGGGVQWSTGTPNFKNTPTNGPACILAARLYTDFKDPADLEWAHKIYDWLKAYMMDEMTGAVIDGLHADNGSMETNIYTYNQGLMIGAAVEMFKLTQDQVYLNDAIKVANYSLNSSSVSTADRLLKDEGNGDGGLFKGVFVRYFTQLILVPELNDNVRQRYISFLKLNAETLWFAGTNKTAGLFGSYWKTPPTGNVDLTTQTSGCTLIEAASLLHKKELL